jgi:hypothetical protein
MRWVMEVGIVLGLGYWGYHTGGSTGMRLLFAVLTPALVFGFWGFVDFRWMGKASEVVRLFQELVITGAVGYALISTGQYALGWGMIGISVVYHALVYLNGDRLVKKDS